LSPNTSRNEIVRRPESMSVWSGRADVAMSTKVVVPCLSAFCAIFAMCASRSIGEPWRRCSMTCRNQSVNFPEGALGRWASERSKWACAFTNPGNTVRWPNSVTWQSVDRFNSATTPPVMVMDALWTIWFEHKTNWDARIADGINRPVEVPANSRITTCSLRRVSPSVIMSGSTWRINTFARSGRNPPCSWKWIGVSSLSVRQPH
jgi:hypothetical protein